jgi:hypothetical protein
MSGFSNWWSGTKNPPPTDAATAAAEEEAAKQHAAATRRMKARSQILNEEPRHVSMVKRTMARRGRHCVARLVYTATVQLTPAQLRSGSVPMQYPVRAELTKTEVNIDSMRASGARSYLIAMDVLESDSRLMPMSIVWRYAGETDVYVALPKKLWRATQERGSRRVIPSVPIFNRSIGVEEPSLSIQFTSFEAVGFNDSNLMQNVAHITPSGLYQIPISYPYSGLLRNVHSACVLAHQRAKWTPLEVETAPLSSYKVQHDDKFMLMRGEDLQRAVGYINKQLVSSNVMFDVENFIINVEPFGGGKWLETWQKALDADDNKLAIAGAASNALPPPITATVVIVVYIGLVPRDGHENGFAMPAQRMDNAANAHEEVRMVASATSNGVVFEHVNTHAPTIVSPNTNGVANDGGRTMEMTMATSDDEDEDEDGSNDDDDNERTAHSTTKVADDGATGSKTLVDKAE